MKMLLLAPAALCLALALPAGAQVQFLGFHLEFIETPGPGPLPKNNYLCHCTPEQFHATPLPGPNWSRNTPNPPFGRIFLPDVSSNVPPIAPPGTPTSLDLIPEIPGDDFFLIARVLSFTPIATSSTDFVGLGQVARDTTLTYFTGRIIHKLTDPEGVEYVLFSFSEEFLPTWDPFVVDGLAGMFIPPGWILSSEVLTEDLTLVVEDGIAEIVSLSGIATFQRAFVPALPACDDGADDDGDGLTDYPDDPGCGSPGDPSENASHLVCDNGGDDDGDGLTDYPDDPGCHTVTATREDAQCQDGLDNDGDGRKDFDGGQSIHGACSGGACPPGVSDVDSDGVADPDLNCGTASKNKETANTTGGGCGLGPELVLGLPALWWMRRRRGELAA